MLRKIIIYSAIVLTLYANNVSYAARVREYTGPLLRQCGMYQIGENELILNLSGRNLPSPEYNAEDKALSIILRNTKIYHPDKIKQSLYATIESVPMGGRRYQAGSRQAAESAFRFAQKLRLVIPDKVGECFCVFAGKCVQSPFQDCPCPRNNSSFPCELKNNP